MKELSKSFNTCQVIIVCKVLYLARYLSRQYALLHCFCFVCADRVCTVLPSCVTYIADAHNLAIL